jgi:hypothetical protein
MARNRASTELIVVHCAATKPSMDIDIREIDRWHSRRGIITDRGLSGYHFFIRRDGTIEPGRELLEMGAHVLGYNDESVGICLAGGIHQTRKLPNGKPEPEDNFTLSQRMALRSTIEFLRYIWPTALVGGHGDFAARACPSFDVHAFMREHFGHDDLELVERYAREHQDR